MSLTPCADFYRPVEELEYTDLLRSTFTGVHGSSEEHLQGEVECHMDPTITKASTGNERLVAACAESQSTSRDPNRTRFLTVQVVIRAKMQCDKKTLLADADASKKRNLLLVGGYTDNPVEECGEGNADEKLKYIRNVFCSSPHSLSVSPVCTQTHRDTGMKSVYVTDRLAIQFKTVRRLIMSEDF